MGKPIRQSLLAGSVQVAVDIGGGLDIAMPHPLLNILQTKALIQKQTCAAMAQFMKANMRQVIFFQQLCKGLRHIVR